jgi:hypothetical protein
MRRTLRHGDCKALRFSPTPFTLLQKHNNHQLDAPCFDAQPIVPTIIPAPFGFRIRGETCGGKRVMARYSGTETVWRHAPGLGAGSSRSPWPLRCRPAQLGRRRRAAQAHQDLLGPAVPSGSRCQTRSPCRAPTSWHQTDDDCSCETPHATCTSIYVASGRCCGPF